MAASSPVIQTSALSLDALRAQIDLRLDALVENSRSGPQRLRDAIRHSLLAPGKRFRPLITVLLAEALGFDEMAADNAVIDVGCAAEMVHTASLILDDLPCMDDADLRRGRATAHVAFGESTAILAAVALLNRAFGVIARLSALPHEVRTSLASQLSRAVGTNGLIAGQVIDLANVETLDTDIETVERLNALKTGALFDFSVLSAAMICQCGPDQTKALALFSKQIGLAFQLLDDVKDSVMNDAQAEKTVGRDIGKATLLALTGQAAALSRLRGYLSAADAALTAANIDPSARIRTAIARQFAFAGEITSAKTKAQ